MIRTVMATVAFLFCVVNGGTVLAESSNETLVKEITERSVALMYRLAKSSPEEWDYISSHFDEWSDENIKMLKDNPDAKPSLPLSLLGVQLLFAELYRETPKSFNEDIIELDGRPMMVEIFTTTTIDIEDYEKAILVVEEWVEEVLSSCRC